MDGLPAWESVSEPSPWPVVGHQWGSSWRALFFCPPSSLLLGS